MTGLHCARSENLMAKLLCLSVSSSHDSEATSQKTCVFWITPLSLYERNSVYHKPEISYIWPQVAWQCHVHTLIITWNKQATYRLLYSRYELHWYFDYIHHQARGIVRLHSDGTYVCQQLAVSLRNHESGGSKCQQLERPNMPATVPCPFLKKNMGSFLYLSMSFYSIYCLLWQELPHTLYATSCLWLLINVRPISNSTIIQ